MKLQSTQLVTEGEHEEKKFFHPYIQIICVFIGQLIVLLYYFLMKKNKEKEKRAYPIIVFSIPASASVITSLLQMTAINFVAPSTFSIFKGATIFGTLLFSKILVKMKITKRHILSCVIAFTGLIIIALSDFVFTGIVKKEVILVLSQK